MYSQIYYKLHYQVHRITNENTSIAGTTKTERNAGKIYVQILLVRVSLIIEVHNREIFRQSRLKFDIFINSSIVYSNFWSPY